MIEIDWFWVRPWRGSDGWKLEEDSLVVRDDRERELISFSITFVFSANEGEL